MIALDTHVVAWLHAGEVERLSGPARDRLESESACICPLVMLELEYLKEIGRISAGAETIVGDLGSEIGLVVAREGLEVIVREALRQNWTRDPFDRMIAAHAVCANLPLATADQTILRNCPMAFWDTEDGGDRTGV